MSNEILENLTTIADKIAKSKYDKIFSDEKLTAYKSNARLNGICQIDRNTTLLL